MQARYRLDLADRFAVSSATARQFASNPSDPTSRWRPVLRTPIAASTARTNSSHPEGSGAHPGGFPHRRPSPAPIEPHLHPILNLRSSCARRGITPAFGYGPRLGSVRLDFHQLATRPARRALRPPPTPTRHRSPLPGSSPVIGADAPTTPIPGAVGPGRVSQVPVATLSTFRAPYAGRFLGAAFQALHPFHGLRRERRGSAPPVPHPHGWAS